jgi:hypothetical protein
MAVRLSALRASRPLFSFYYSYCGETESIGTAATIGLLYHPQMIGDGDCEQIGE